MERAKTVLVVDDNPAVRTAICNLFTSETDFNICGQAENGRDAIEKAYQLRPDLIILDLSMPEMNGLETAQFLGAIMPHVPIIMFSDYADALKTEGARSAGIAAVVSKDNASMLIAKARSVLARRAS